MKNELNNEIAKCNEAIMAIKKGVPHLSSLVIETGIVDWMWYVAHRKACARQKARI